MTVRDYANMLLALPDDQQAQSLCIFRAGLAQQLRGVRPVQANAHGTSPAYVEAVTWIPPAEASSAPAAEKGAPKK